jgi:hypothetical protein
LAAGICLSSHHDLLTRGEEGEEEELVSESHQRRQTPFCRLTEYQANANPLQATLMALPNQFDEAVREASLPFLISPHRTCCWKEEKEARPFAQTFCNQKRTCAKFKMVLERLHFSTSVSCNKTIEV